MFSDSSSYVHEMVVKWNVNIHDVIKGIEFLRIFGYLSPNGKIDAKDILKAVKVLQTIYGLKTTDGEFGPKTLTAINRPRCGCPDNFILESKEAINKWKPRSLTYYIRNRDNDLSSEIWDVTIALALQQWSDVADLSFTEVNNQRIANLIFDVGSKSRENFGKRGGTLAWAYLPPQENYNGQLLCKFDTAETWITGGNNGIRLLNVACHEIGNLLGLCHSDKKSALMAPYYNINVTKPQKNDDISRVVTLYGEPKSKPKPEPTPDDIVNIKIKGEVLEVEGYRLNKF